MKKACNSLLKNPDSIMECEAHSLSLLQRASYRNSMLYSRANANIQILSNGRVRFGNYRILTEINKKSYPRVKLFNLIFSLQMYL